jgi:hypothetical protein
VATTKTVKPSNTSAHAKQRAKAAAAAARAKAARAAAAKAKAKHIKRTPPKPAPTKPAPTKSFPLLYGILALVAALAVGATLLVTHRVRRSSKQGGPALESGGAPAAPPPPPPLPSAVNGSAAVSEPLAGAAAAAAVGAEVAAARPKPVLSAYIVLWHGYFEWRFMALVRTDESPSYVLAESPGFRPWRKSDQSDPSEKARAAYGVLLEKLEQLGWRVGDTGDRWYQPKLEPVRAAETNGASHEAGKTPDAEPASAPTPTS